MTIRSIMICLSALTAALLVEAGADSRPNILKHCRNWQDDLIRH